ncbi:hypothetical protein E1B28_013451 [Marasmius oreades]|uniref:PIH1 N-terminal domain-containing protein n=1 Tax=Marasmius oreades TaxID=181124 RepID=A0A9P7RPU1_9AGAR|nr:uncharacterized protein E1B28_013451 [Marasmius oreades]KAG7087489.1 hypothetical protein E1B28_013451 [Marasmius oreades]
MSVSVILKPIPGFCIKSSTVQPAVYKPSSSQQPLTSLEPGNAPVPIPVGFKLFINIAWDQNVPPPPKASEEAIKRAISGDSQSMSTDDDYFVPVVVSDGRIDTDRAGRPSLVFDCVFHKSVKTRTLVDHDFKVFIVELALQRIEAQTGLVLSRELGTPNIASKGKLEPRSVSLPSFLAQNVVLNAPSSGVTNKPLIEEIPSPAPTTSKSASDQSAKPKGILKKNLVAEASTERRLSEQLPLDWSWAFQNDQIRISISVPHLVSRNVNFLVLPPSGGLS